MDAADAEQTLIHRSTVLVASRRTSDGENLICGEKEEERKSAMSESRNPRCNVC